MNKSDEYYTLEKGLLLQEERQKVMSGNLQKLTEAIDKLITHMDKQEVRNQDLLKDKTSADKTKSEILILTKDLESLTVRVNRNDKFTTTFIVIILTTILGKVLQMVFIK